MLGHLIRKQRKSASKHFCVVQLNARLQPIHRGEFFEDELDEALKKSRFGVVSGGGTFRAQNGEIEHCDIEIELSGDSSAAVQLIITTLDALGTPKGSKLHLNHHVHGVGSGLSP